MGVGVTKLMNDSTEREDKKMIGLDKSDRKIILKISTEGSHCENG